MPVCLDRLDATPGRELPDPYRLVIRTREQEFPIRVEDERPNPVVMTRLLDEWENGMGWKSYNQL